MKKRLICALLAVTLVMGTGLISAGADQVNSESVQLIKFLADAPAVSTNADVIEAKAEKAAILKGQTQVFTVTTGSAATVLQMFLTGKTKAFKTWKAPDYSVQKGDVRIWTVEVAFSGAGVRSQYFKAGKSTKQMSGVTKTVEFTVEDGTAGVASVSLAAQSMLKGQEQVFTVRTDADAQYLMMHIEDGSLFKTWTANQCSVTAGKERIWTIRMKLSGAGKRTLTFKAAKADNTPYPMTRTVSFTVEKANTGVIGAEAAEATLLKGQNQVFTVRTDSGAKYLMMYVESGKLFKTWAADSKNSRIEGTERIWTVSLKFSGAGKRTLTFKAGKTKTPAGVSKQVSFKVDKNDTGVVSVEADSSTAIKGCPFTFHVATNSAAQYLTVYIENGKLFKTWKADSKNSKVSGTQRIWTVSISFSGTGVRTLTFGAGKTEDAISSIGKGITFNVDSYGVVSAKAASENVAQKTDLVFTIETPSSAKYLMIYVENGSLFKTLKADSKNSKVSGKIRTWTFTQSFSTAGDRVLTFRTGTDSTAKGASVKVPFTVTPEEFEIKKGVLVSYNGTATEVTIPEGKGIKTIGKDAFRGNQTVTKIILPSGVTKIEARAFEYCAALKTVTVPKTLKTIGTYAFNQCVKLKDVTNLKSTAVTEVAEGVFCECKAMQSISLPDAVTKIGRRAFYHCTSLKNMN